MADLEHRHCPDGPGLSPEEKKEEKSLAARRGKHLLNPKTCIGWVHGSVLGYDEDRVLVFVVNGQGLIYPVYFMFNRDLFESWCKQIYVA